MDLFKDKTYEQMDEVSQMIEPFEFQLNVQLSEFPDEFALEAECFDTLVNYNARRFGYYNAIYDDLRKIVERKASELGLTLLAETARVNRKFLEQFFDFSVSEGAWYDAETNQLHGEVLVKKIKIAYDDKDIDQIMREYIVNTFNNAFYTAGDVSKERTNEILDLFNIKDGLSDRKALGKIHSLKIHYVQLIDDRALIIKDIELFKRFIDWNVKYIKNGNLPAFSNITKVKIMMRKGLPIYSINEDVT